MTLLDTGAASEAGTFAFDVLPDERVPPATVGAVAVVDKLMLLRCDERQVIDVHARFVLAQVMKLVAVRYRSNQKLVESSVCVHVPTSDLDNAIATRVRRFVPQNALGRATSYQTERLGGWLSGVRRGRGCRVLRRMGGPSFCQALLVATLAVTD